MGLGGYRLLPRFFWQVHFFEALFEWSCPHIFAAGIDFSGLLRSGDFYILQRHVLVWIVSIVTDALLYRLSLLPDIENPFCLLSRGSAPKTPSSCTCRWPLWLHRRICCGPTCGINFSHCYNYSIKFERGLSFVLVDAMWLTGVLLGPPLLSDVFPVMWPLFRPANGLSRVLSRPVQERRPPFVTSPLKNLFWLLCCDSLTGLFRRVDCLQSLYSWEPSIPRKSWGTVLRGTAHGHLTFLSSKITSPVPALTCFPVQGCTYYWCTLLVMHQPSGGRRRSPN